MTDESAASASALEDREARAIRAMALVDEAVQALRDLADQSAETSYGAANDPPLRPRTNAAVIMKDFL